MKQISKQITKIISLAILATTACSVYATDVGVGAEIGTLGAGAHLDWQASDKVSVKTGYTTGNVELEDAIEKYGLDFDVNAEFKTPYVSVQYRPMNNWFTVNGGVAYIGNNDFSAVSTPKNQTKFTVDGKDYALKTDAKIDVDVNFKNKMVPYFTVGANKEVNKKLGLFAELGAGYTGGYTKNINLDKSYVNSEVIEGKDYDASQELTDAEYEELTSKMEKDIADKLAGKVKITKAYPIVKVGMTYKF